MTTLEAVHAQGQSLDQLRVWHSPDNTRLVFDVSASTEYKTFILQMPLRLVVDLEQVDLSVSLPEVQTGNRHLSAIRSGQPVPNVLRVVFDLKRPVNIDSFVLKPNKLYGHRLVIDLADSVPSSDNELEASDSVVGFSSNQNTIESIDTSISVATQKNLDVNELIDIETKADVSEAVANSTDPMFDAVNAKIQVQTKTEFVVAIDAGHGGDDPGATGYRGTKEKQLTLAIAKKLNKKINTHPDMRAELVRTGDYYVKLQGRRKKARKLGADVFISIHADAFTKTTARGMSVFALSQRGATSAMASTLAAKENASDLIGGVSLADKDEVLAKVLVDLSMTNTISESVNLGGRVLAELGQIGRLHSKRVEQANFSVLRSADVASILVETGFITNPEEEKKLKSSSYQNKIASAIYDALEDYFEQTPYASRARYESPDVARNDAKSNTKRKAKRAYGRHKVVSGDSLSTIAKRYGISLRELKRLNKIKHNTAMLGVKLKVPIRTSSLSANVIRAVGPVFHKIRSGDSLSKISLQYNVTIKAIKRANGLSGNSLIKGKKLKIPGGISKAKPQKRRYKVVRGDTLSEIAQQYGSTIAKIKKANKLGSNSVRLGQILTIPY